MSVPPSVPAWLHDIPPGLEDDPPAPPHDEVPHPADLTNEELADLLGPGYSGHDVKSSTSELILDPLWWSLGNAAEYIEASTENSDVEDSPLFQGLNRIEAALRSGELQAYGSIDAAPIRPIPVEAWPAFVMVASNIAPTVGEAISYDISIRSVRSYRAIALNDHSFPSGEWVPSASAPKGEPGYHRVVSDAFVKESDVRKFISVTLPQNKQRRIGKKQLRLAATLPDLKIRGNKVYPDRGPVSFADITRAVIKVWIKEDERQGRPIEYNQSTEEQGINRFYRSFRNLPTKPDVATF